MLIVFPLVLWFCVQKGEVKINHCDTNWIQAATKTHNCFQCENELKCIWFEPNEPLLTVCAKLIRISICACVYITRERSKQKRVKERKQTTQTWCVCVCTMLLLQLSWLGKSVPRNVVFQPETRKRTNPQWVPAKRTNVRMRQSKKKS